MPTKRPSTPQSPTQARQPLEVRREVSAGGLIWRCSDPKRSGFEVVLVRPSGKSTWVLPKGHVEPGETLLDAALREANEESGLKVEAGQPLGQVSYLYSWRDRPAEQPVRVLKRVHFYLMRCIGGDPSDHDTEVEEVVWLSLDEALRRASHKSERDLIAKARKALHSQQ